MLTEYGIAPLVYDAATPTVPLDNGGYLVIEHTEAMTVVDVNTGSYVGETSLEDTVFAVNLAACEEIARQVRLRNIGGIVTIDFIDMLEQDHKEAVTQTLRDLLAQDSAKCNVLPMNELCITQFTRKRVGNEIYSVLTKKCEHCNGGGYLAEDIFIVSRIRAALLKCFAKGFKSAIVELSDKVMKKIFAEGLLTKEVHKRWQDKRIYLVPHRTYKEYHFVVYGENSSVLQLPNTAQLLY